MRKNIEDENKHLCAVHIFLGVRMQSYAYRGKVRRNKNAEYSDLSGISIGMRGRQCVVVRYNDIVFMMRHRYDKPSEIRSLLTTFDDSIIIMPFSDGKRFEKALNVFEDLSVTNMVVDENANVYLKLYWNDQCIYDFIRVQPGYSLDEVKELFCRNEDYVLYEDNRYVHKENKE